MKNHVRNDLNDILFNIIQKPETQIEDSDIKKLSDFLNENNNKKVYEETFNILFRNVISMKNDDRFLKKPFKGKDVRELYTQWIKSFKLLYFIYESNEKIRKYFNRGEVIHEIIDIILFLKKRKDLNKTVIETNYSTKLFKRLLKYMAVWKEEFKKSRHLKLGVEYLNDNGIKLPDYEISRTEISTILERGNMILDAAKTIIDESQGILDIINKSNDENAVENDILNEEDEEFGDIEFEDVDDNESTIDDPDVIGTLEESIASIKQIINRIDDFISTLLVIDSNINHIKERLLENKNNLNRFIDQFNSINNTIKKETQTSNQNVSIEIELGHSIDNDSKTKNDNDKSDNTSSSSVSKKRPRKSVNTKNALLQNLKLIKARRKRRKPIV